LFIQIQRDTESKTMSRVRNGTGRVQKELEAHPGTQPPSASVVGLKELDRLRELVAPPKEDLVKKEAELKASLSKSRAEGWNNTVEGHHKAKLDARKKRMEEAEFRRQLIDAEEQALHEAHHRALVDEANRQIHLRDERVKNLNSQLLLNEVLQERKEQIALSARLRDEKRQRDLEYDTFVMREAEAERLRNQEKVLSARQRALEVTQDRRQQLQEQLQQKRAEKAAEVRTGLDLRKSAELEVYELNKQKEEARIRAREVALELVKQNQQKVLNSPRKTEGGLGPDPVLEEQNLNFLLHKQKQNALMELHQQEKRELKDEKRRAVAEQYASTPRKREEAAEILTHGKSILDKFVEGEEARLSARQRLKKDREQEASSVPVSPSRARELSQKEREKAMQVRVAQQLKEIDEEEREEALRKKQELIRLQHFHELQTKQKHVNDAQHDQVIREEGVHMRALREEEDEMFAKYIEAQLPSDMDPVLRVKATKMPKPVLIH
jgi:hypothetical protein